MRTQVQSLASLSGLRLDVAVSCGVGCIHCSDPALLWLWPRPAATSPIRPLAWEPPYAMCAALKRRNDQKKKKNYSWIHSPLLDLYFIYKSSTTALTKSILDFIPQKLCHLVKPLNNAESQFQHLQNERVRTDDLQGPIYICIFVILWQWIFCSWNTIL